MDYLWTTFDADNSVLYVLRRHEDEPVMLTQRLYTIDIANAKLLNDVEVNSTIDSFSSLHYSSTHRSLISVSPGNIQYLLLTL